jgi:replicative DNA helicase
MSNVVKVNDWDDDDDVVPQREQRVEKFLDRPLPSDEEAEKTLLGACFLDDKLFDSIKMLDPNEFYSPFHRRVFMAMKTIHAVNGSMDPITVLDQMEKEGSTALLGGVSAVANLTYGLPRFSEKTIEEYVKRVRGYAVSRELIHLAGQVQSSLLQRIEEVPVIVQDLEHKIITLNNRVNMANETEDGEGFYSLASVVPMMIQQFSDYHEGKESGVKTGIPELDHKLDGGGLQPGGVYLLGASEKAGKTSLALAMGYDISYGQDTLFPIVTLEISKLVLAKRLFTLHTGIPYSEFRPGFRDTSYNNNAYTKALHELETFGRIPVIIADRLFGFSQIARYLRRLVDQSRKPGNRPIKAAMIDYMQLIIWDGERTQNREREVANLSRSLKRLAVELGIALIIISNMNREGLKEGAEPTSFNLRESGQLAFDAEAVLLLHNPSYVPGKPYEPKDVTDYVLIIDRHRSGPTGRIKMKFVGKHMCFMSESQWDKFVTNTMQGQPAGPQTMMLVEKEMDEGWDQADVIISIQEGQNEWEED